MEEDKDQQCGKVYSELWKEFKGDLFNRYTDDLWYRWNRYDLWLDPEIQGKIILDAGFGSGRALMSILNAGAKKVYGIDISPINVKTAKENLSICKDRVDIIEGSVLDMPYEDNMFDIVHSYGVLHHTSDPREGFNECCRVLKPGGILFIAMYNRGGLIYRLLSGIRFFTTKGIPPLSVAKKISQLVFGNDKNHYWYGLLDGFYGPIREAYTEDELRFWFNQNGIIDVVRYYCTWSYYSWHPFFSGKDRGLIILKGRKQEEIK